MPVSIHSISRGQATTGLDAAQYGSKAAHLAHLLEKGFAVPPAVAVSIPTAESSAPSYIADILAAVENALGRGTPCCIRSSFLNEDTASASRAGQYESVFGLQSGAGLHAHLEDYLARARTTIKEDLPRLSFLVQAELQADLSGIVFSQHPDPSMDSHVAIQYVVGHGLGLTEGSRDPRQLLLSRFSGQILASRDQHAPGTSLLAPDTTRKIWQAARALEEDWGQAVDFEFVVCADVLYMLQVRPVTAFAGGEDRFLWSRAAADEFWSGNVSPPMWASAGNAIQNTMLRRPLAALPDPWLWQYPLLKRHAERVYLNTEAIRYVYNALPGWARVRALADMAGLQAYSWRPFPLFPLRFLQLVQAFYRARFRWLPWMPLHDQEVAIARGQSLFEQTLAAPDAGKYDEILAGLETHLSQAVWGMVWAYVLIQLFVRLTEMLRLGDHFVQILMAGNARDPVFRLEQDIRLHAKRIAHDASTSSAAVDSLVNKYGYLAFSRDIVAERWYDNHTIAESLLRASPRKPMAVFSALGATRKATLELAMRGRLLAATAVLCIAPLTWLARRWVAYREEMRLSSDRYLAALRLHLQHTAPDTLQTHPPADGTAPDWLQGSTIWQTEESVPGDETDLYRGVPLYRGDIIGICHQILVPADLQTFPDGAILVSEYLDPSLGTLMARAGGALFTYGGALSHGGILAREHQVPSLCGIDQALQRFPNGTRVRIDSRRGVVQVLTP